MTATITTTTKQPQGVLPHYIMPIPMDKNLQQFLASSRQVDFPFAQNVKPFVLHDMRHMRLIVKLVKNTFLLVPRKIII